MRKAVTVSIFVCLVLLSGVAMAHGNDNGNGNAKNANGIQVSHANSDLADVRQVTAKYHNESQAVADGYIPTDHCVSNMGYHYVNPGLLDGDINASQPEILVYAPVGNSNNGKRKLVAVEYFIDANETEDTPTLFGQEFNGPMPGHEPGQPVHYDLHAWVWQANPDGVFTPFNPNIRC
ncbi:MAG: hypothetical protein SXQ77_08065 [Halobacteria archaeon]|nr:hypothetical protein [Halobacteria archaeon]